LNTLDVVHKRKGYAFSFLALHKLPFLFETPFKKGYFKKNPLALEAKKTVKPFKRTFYLEQQHQSLEQQHQSLESLQDKERTGQVLPSCSSSFPKGWLPFHSKNPWLPLAL